MNSDLSSLSEYFELRFATLANAGSGFVFPCDAAGQVDLNRLSPRARNNYFLARALVGRDYGSPQVVRMLCAA